MQPSAAQRTTHGAGGCLHKLGSKPAGCRHGLAVHLRLVCRRVSGSALVAADNCTDLPILQKHECSPASRGHQVQSRRSAAGGCCGAPPSSCRTAGRMGQSRDNRRPHEAAAGGQSRLQQSAQLRQKGAASPTKLQPLLAKLSLLVCFQLTLPSPAHLHDKRGQVVAAAQLLAGLHTPKLPTRLQPVREAAGRFRRHQTEHGLGCKHGVGAQE